MARTSSMNAQKGKHHTRNMAPCLTGTDYRPIRFHPQSCCTSIISTTSVKSISLVRRMECQQLCIFLYHFFTICSLSWSEIFLMDRLSLSDRTELFAYHRLMPWRIDVLHIVLLSFFFKYYFSTFAFYYSTTTGW